MLIRRATVTLAGVSLTGGKGITDLSIDGQAVADVVSLVGAASVSVSAKGNASMSIRFTAVHEFASDALLEVFALSHFGTLTKGGALAFTVGSTTKTASSAAVVGVSFGEPIGLLLPVTYSIVSSPLL